MHTLFWIDSHSASNLRKIKHLLSAIDAANKHAEYYALDLDESELRRTLSAIPEGTFKHVSCSGLHGTFDDGLEWLQRPEIRSRPKVVLFVGSSIGNFPRAEAAKFVRRFTTSLKDHGSFLIGIDACQDSDKVALAYNDTAGVTERFTLNGLKHANHLLGQEVFVMSQWRFVARYDSENGKNQAFVSPTVDVEILGVQIAKDELLRIEESYKYSGAQATELWRAAGAKEVACWLNDAGDYGTTNVTILLLADNDRSTLDSAQYVCLFTARLCCTPSADAARMARSVEDLGYRNVANDPK